MDKDFRVQSDSVTYLVTFSVIYSVLEDRAVVRLKDQI